MDSGQIWRRLVSTTPATKVSVAVTVVALLIWITLPIAELQGFFWGLTVVGFLIGDTITTGYLANFGLEEQENGYTRWICGADPTLFCAATTRIIAFGVVFGLYSLVIRYSILLQYQLMEMAVLMTPVVFGLMGIGATVLNSYAMWKVSISK